MEPVKSFGRACTRVYLAKQDGLAILQIINAGDDILPEWDIPRVINAHHRVFTRTSSNGEERGTFCKVSGDSASEEIICNRRENNETRSVPRNGIPGLL